MKLVFSRIPAPLLMTLVLVAVCGVMLYCTLFTMVAIVRPIIKETFTTGFQGILNTLPKLKAIGEAMF